MGGVGGSRVLPFSKMVSYHSNAVSTVFVSDTDIDRKDMSLLNPLGYVINNKSLPSPLAKNPPQGVPETPPTPTTTLDVRDAERLSETLPVRAADVAGLQAAAFTWTNISPPEWGVKNCLKRWDVETLFSALSEFVFVQEHNRIPNVYSIFCEGSVAGVIAAQQSRSAKQHAEKQKEITMVRQDKGFYTPAEQQELDDKQARRDEETKAARLAAEIAAKVKADAAAVKAAAEKAEHERRQREYAAQAPERERQAAEAKAERDAKEKRLALIDPTIVHDYIEWASVAGMRPRDRVAREAIDAGYSRDDFASAFSTHTATDGKDYNFSLDSVRRFKETKAADPVSIGESK